MMILVVLRWLVFGDDHVIVAVLIRAIFYGVVKSQYQNLIASDI